MKADPLSYIIEFKLYAYLSLVLLMTFAFPFNGGAQRYFNPYPTHLKDSSYHYLQPDIPKKHFGRAATELVLAEIVPWTIDRYIRKADYAKISFKTVGHNLSLNNWAWDNDEFQTNQFGHPYHGNYFFNTFRTNGYSFWQSAPAAFVGSYIWETTAENQAPAPNDFINTSFGGIILGEMTYRLSNKIVNNRSRGLKRQASEVLALLVNPVNGINRLLDGKWGKIYGNSTDHDSSRLQVEFDAGLRNFSVNNKSPFQNGHFGWYGRIKLLYGDANENFKVPFTNITVLTEFGQDDSTKLNIVSVYGSLTGWKIYGKNNTHLAILSANYDYYHNAAFFFGAQSVKMNLYSQFNLPGKFVLNTSFGLGPVLLAAVPDPHLYNGRNYDYGPGFAVNAGGRVSFDSRISLGVNYRGGWMKTLNGNKSDYFLHAISNEFIYTLLHGFSLAAEAGYFNLHGNYADFDDTDKKYPYVRLSVRFITGYNKSIIKQ
ncbi:DUF3943 domain-containing protein [Mucilaginibacter sp.]|jgi:hypothetical protein|uniref:DUF3943 domain-containing protein n=1 Tax=Mucilaginibacter sp. TaxID=1882438 RepID=UPI002BF0A2B3|nr:DUF3943 domain-containing protein [Mucilaginibacter sp.]HTI61741.1 DUF3943 domain-containing protein [Mucilaginibacter sp.]